MYRHHLLHVVDTVGDGDVDVDDGDVFGDGIKISKSGNT